MNAIAQLATYTPDALQKRLEWAAFTEMALHAIGQPVDAPGWPLELAECIIDNGWWLEFGPPKPRDIAQLAEVNGWFASHVHDPMNRKVLRARALAHPITDSYIFAWSDIGRMVKMSKPGAMKRHRRALELLADSLLTEIIFE